MKNILIILIFICGTVFPPLWDSLPGGGSGGAWVGAASAADRYVSLNGTNDADNGYTNWVGVATKHSKPELSHSKPWRGKSPRDYKYSIQEPAE